MDRFYKYHATDGSDVSYLIKSDSKERADSVAESIDEIPKICIENNHYIVVDGDAFSDVELKVMKSTVDTTRKYLRMERAINDYISAIRTIENDGEVQKLMSKRQYYLDGIAENSTIMSTCVCEKVYNNVEKISRYVKPVESEVKVEESEVKVEESEVKPVEGEVKVEEVAAESDVKPVESEVKVEES